MVTTAHRTALLALLSPLLLVVVWAALPASSYAVAMVVHATTLAAAGVAMGRASRRGDERLRRPRRWLTAGLAASGAGFVVAAVESTVRGEVPAVGFANLAPLVWVPCVLLGMLAVPSQEHREGSRGRALLDGVVVTAALSLGSWIVFLQPTWQATSRTGLERAVLLAYPLIDLVLRIAALAWPRTPAPTCAGSCTPPSSACCWSRSPTAAPPWRWPAVQRRLRVAQRRAAGRSRAAARRRVHADRDRRRRREPRRRHRRRLRCPTCRSCSPPASSPRTS